MARSETRLASDKEKLDALVRADPSLVRVTRSVGRPPNQYILELRCRGIDHVAGGLTHYRDTHTIEILLGPEYPFREPKVTFNTPILHPHIYTNNQVCLGDWRTTEFLDLLVKRLFKVIQYFPEYLNSGSVANFGAQDWVEENEHLLPLGVVVPGEGSPPTPRPKFIFTPE